MEKDYSQAVVLGAAAAIFYLAHRKGTSVGEKAQTKADPERSTPAQIPYEELGCNNTYVQGLIIDGYRPHVTLGAGGATRYYYPKPGGKGYWVTYNPHSIISL